MKTMNQKIDSAIKKIKLQKEPELFESIYSFATENIKGYIDKFNLKDKSLLTVGSSSDQVFNAFYNGCRDITLIDINPYAKEYFYLKKASIYQFSYEDFFKFISLHSNENALNLEMFKVVIDEIEEESREFWKAILQETEPKEIKYNLFSHDRQKARVIKETNNYLRDEKSYCTIKSNIKELNPKFIQADIFEYHLNRSYDNIFLSNIASYKEVKYMHKHTEVLKENLKENGQMLIAYLYQIKENLETRKKYCEIYDLNNTLHLFEDATLETIPGIESTLKNVHHEDGILIYRKK